MSINWVMLDNSMKDFVRLPREKIAFTSPPRTALSLQSPNSYPGKEPLSIKCSDGRAIITNRRLIYLPTSPTTQFQSFQSPILSLQDTHVSAPFFGPNIWEGLLVPTPGGGMQPHQLVQMKLTFKEGGAFDFSTIYERLKETMSQSAEVIRETGGRYTDGEANLEQLPAYEETPGSGNMAAAQQPASPAVTVTAERSNEKIARPTPISPTRRPNPQPRENGGNGIVNSASASTQPTAAPNEPPPAYDETAPSPVVNGLENRVQEKETE